MDKKIIVDKSKWKENDIIHMLERMYDNSNYINQVKSLGIHIEDNSLRDEEIQLLSNMIDKNNFAYKFLFTEHNKFNFMMDKELYEYYIDENVEKYKDCPYELYIKKLNKIAAIRELIHKIEFTMDNSSQDCEENYIIKLTDKLLSDKTTMIDYLNNLNYTSETKWEILRFTENPQIYYDEISNIIKKIKPYYEEYISKHEAEMVKFNEKVSENFDKYGFDYINKFIKTNINSEEYKKIIISTTYVNNYDVMIYMFADNIHINLGIDCEKLADINNREINFENSISIVKGLSDTVKLNILLALNEKEMYGKELCDRLGISKALLSYHLDFLTVNDIIEINPEGNKIYYKINREKIKSAFECISHLFKL